MGSIGSTARPGSSSILSTATSNLNSDAVLSLAEDRSGGIWIATWAGGVSRFDPQTGRFTPFTPKNSGMADDNAFAVYTDRGGRVWIGTYSKGLQRVDPATGTFSAPILLGKGKQSQIRIITELFDGRLLLSARPATACFSTIRARGSSGPTTSARTA